MKQKFKVQPYQTRAVNSVLGCFDGQLFDCGVSYRIDPGRGKQVSVFEEGLKNANIQLTKSQFLENIHQVQKYSGLNASPSLRDFRDYKGKSLPASYKPGSDVNLDIEMETGTGKTYCYIKTMFEMNKRFGWSKFIIMVPSIAIREGVNKSLQDTADHFMESYGKRIRFFIYNSKSLHELESFSSDAGINVMIINIQAFNARGADNRRIYDEIDDFQTRRPIDVISANRPILILDEPQKMGGPATLKALPKFNPLMILRYSATHKINHNKIHRLDALDAYNEKLVKKIAVRGIQTRGLAGTNAYLYLESIEISKQAPRARIDMEVKLKSGLIKRQVKRLERGRDLYAESGELDQYKGFTIAQIDYNNDTVEFTNGHILSAGEAAGDISEDQMRRIQIRETIKAHLDKEKQLFSQGIKILSLFFIDEVVKYRDYSQADEKGEYARIFEEEYALLINEYLSGLAIDNEAYRKYLENIEVSETHKGYFSIDKKGKAVDAKSKTKSELKESTDIDAYDLILKDKESLFSFPALTDDEETRKKKEVRFIFSHSALREGWDNPNVFTICMLKHSDNTVSRRQEVGRGLRISVNQNGERMDHPATVHDINVLTVVASESYKDFVTNLQKEIGESLSERPRIADEAYFTGKIITTEKGTLEITPTMAKQIYRYLLKNDYSDDADQITDIYHEEKSKGELAPLPAELLPHKDQIFVLIDSVFSDSQLPDVDNDRKPKTNPLNENFNKKEFQELWARINQKAVYRVDFESDELIQKCINALEKELRVTPLQYTVRTGVQGDDLSTEQLNQGDGFEVTGTTTERGGSIHSRVKYDLLGKVGENVQLTRRTVADILAKVSSTVFDQFKENPEHFIAEASRLIKEQKATMVIEQLSYDTVADRYVVDIFTANQSKQDFTRASDKLKRHVYDYVITDSNIEREFVKELDTRDEVIVYAKLPRGFQIPTPVGDYNPDWAISFKENKIKHIYFVAETKGSMSSMQLRAIEDTKIKCARKFFTKLGEDFSSNKVRYDVIPDYEALLNIVGLKAAS